MRLTTLVVTVFTAAACLLSGTALAARSVTDITGRTVTIPDKVERIILGQGRFLVALGILEGEQLTRRLVGTMSEFHQLDPDGYAQYLARFPELEKLPRIGQTATESFSTEQAISLRPQVALFGLEGHGPSPSDQAIIDRLQAAGVAVVFIDFRRDPLVHTPRSMEILGKLLGREARAKEFIGVWRAELAKVQAGLQGVSAKPRVFLESRVGLREECCETMVSGMMGRFIDAAGGDNMARKLVPGEVGTVNLEYLLTEQPDIYVATAIGYRAGAANQPRRILMGAGVTQAEAQASLARSMQRPGISGLRAIKQGRAHAIWHHFYDSPFNVVAVQAFAKWFHPQRFAALDPQVTRDSMFKRFQPVAPDGTYWTSLK